MAIFQDTYSRARRNARKVIVGTAIVTAGVVVAAPWGGGGGGSVTANLWVGAGGTCTRSASPAAYNSATACASLTSAYQASSANAADTIRVVAGDYGNQSFAVKSGQTADTSPANNTNFIAQGTVKLALDLSASGGVKGVNFTGFTFTNTGNNGADAADIAHASDVAFYDGRFWQRVYLDSSSDVLFDHMVWEPRNSSTSGQAFESGWGLAVYQQNGEPAPNRITVQDSIFRHIRATLAADHPDAIFTYETNDPSGALQNFLLQRTTFYDNECINLRTDPHQTMTIRNNFFGAQVSGISGCGYYSADVYEANATVLYNTFESDIQTNSGFTATQSWVGNLGRGMSSSCGVTNASTVMKYNVWTSQDCSVTDKQVTLASLKFAGGSTYPDNLFTTSGSTAIDAGDLTNYPADDGLAHSRYAGSGPDAGAYEFGS